MVVVGDMTNFTWGGRDGSVAVHSGPEQVCLVLINLP